MFPRFVAVLLLAAPPAAVAQGPDGGLPPGILLLSRIKRHVAAEMAHLPDYTCLLTMQRYHRQPGPKSVLQPLDVMRLEVLDTVDKELYAPPGSQGFEQDHPGSFTSTGLSGTGIFALAVRNLLVNDKGLFQYRGEEQLAGRRAVRYDYRVPLLDSGFQIEVGGVRGRVASKGSFWADPESLDLLRLEIVADDIPPNLPMVSSVQTVTYARTHIGDRTIMLPESAGMDLVDTDGAEDRNVLEFTHCRAYQSRSSVTFITQAAAPGQPPAMGLPPSEAPVEALPAGIPIAITLSAPITGTETVGTPVEGRLAGAIAAGKSGIQVPDGAVVHGRIRLLEPPLVALEFTEIEAGGIAVRFFADLQTVDAPAAVESATGASLPGVGTLTTPKFPLPAGFRMVWRTRAL